MVMYTSCKINMFSQIPLFEYPLLGVRGTVQHDTETDIAGSDEASSDSDHAKCFRCVISPLTSVKTEVFYNYKGRFC